MKTATPNPKKIKDGRAVYRILKICVKYPQPSRLVTQFGGLAAFGCSQHLRAARFHRVYTLDEALAELRAVQSGPPPPEKLEKAQQDVRDAEQKLKDLENDLIIGDDYDQIYESIAKLVGMRAPKDIWGGAKFAIAGNVKKAIRAEHSENLFKIESDNSDLETRINKSKIKELEDYIKDASTGSALGKGIKLLTVDFNEIHFPERSTITAKTEMNLVETDASHAAEQRDLYEIVLRNLYSNLARLEAKAARYGMDIPIKIENEIEFTKEKIAEFEAKLEALEARGDKD